MTAKPRDKTEDDKVISAIIKSLEKDQMLISDGFGWYTGAGDKEYYRIMKKVARHILSAIRKAQGDGHH